MTIAQIAVAHSWAGLPLLMTFQIYTAFGFESLQGRTLIEAKANAKLIAAAPELLNACIKAAEQICNHESGHTLQFQRVQDLLDNVIAKATGSTHNTVNK
jgi:hypothetical protein